MTPSASVAFGRGVNKDRAILGVVDESKPQGVEDQAGIT